MQEAMENKIDKLADQMMREIEEHGKPNPETEAAYRRATGTGGENETVPSTLAGAAREGSGVGAGAEGPAGERAPTADASPAVRELTAAAAKEELKAGNLNAAARRRLGIKGRRGELDLGVAAQSVKEKVLYMYDAARRFGGAMLPTMARASEKSSDASGQFISARPFASTAAEYFLNLLRPGVSKEVADKWMAAHQELRFRYAEGQYKKEAARLWREAQVATDPAEKRRLLAESAAWTNKEWGMGTFVFGPRNRATQNVVGGGILKEAEFQAIINDPAFKAYRERYRKELAPILEEWFRAAEGIDPADKVERMSQMPDEPLSAFAVDPASTDAAVHVGTGRAGNLNNVKQKKLGVANEFSGSGEHYETNFDNVITRMIEDRVAKAKHAQMNNTLVSEGLATWGHAGERKEGTESFSARPPKGTTAAEQGQDTLYVRNDVAGEYRQALATDRQWAAELRKYTQFANQAVLFAGMAEATTHTANLTTSIFEPGAQPWFHPIEYAQRIRAVWMRTPEVQKKLMELAEIGAAKEKGFESGSMPWLGKLDPTKWGSKVIDFIDTVQRLALSDAFDRKVGQGLIKGGVDLKNADPSSYNVQLRNFINGVLGQYNKRAQPWIVALGRDTGMVPFATATSTFHVQGIRALTGSSPLEASSWTAAVRLRAEKLAAMGTVLALVPLWNWSQWGNPFGDDNTPIGAVKTGTTAEGKTSYFDVASLTGLRRGARLTGLLALAEGNRSGARAAGATNPDIANRAQSDIGHGLLGLLEGPATQSVNIFATGRDLMGRRVAHDAHQEGGYQQLANLQAVLYNMNPTVATLSGAAHPGHQPGRLLGVPTPGSETPMEERLWELPGRMALGGRRVSGRPPGAPLLGARR